MVFADLKNDFVFRRIFATHPDILRSLLNDLLERSGDRTIESIECKAYVSQLKATEMYSKLTDVVAISICDFELWPDAKQKEQGLPLVPMLSRWNMTERKSGNDGLLQVQYAFLELPKLPNPRPEAPGADLWAWLFVHAPELKEVPTDLSPGPYREALELANKATFTQEELDAYQKVIDEIQQVRELAEAKLAEGEAIGLAKGEAIGLAKGEAIGLAKGLLAVLEARGISIVGEARTRIEACKDEATLHRWLARATTALSLDDVFAA
jgi:hypothetical protein